jgi:hypothetical protein
LLLLLLVLLLLLLLLSNLFARLGCVCQYPLQLQTAVAL